MAKFYLETSGLNRTVDAEDWDVKWDLLVLYDAQGRKVLAVKADSVKEISLQPEQK